MAKRKIKVLALSSGGGHWVQLLRLRPAFDGCDITYATTRRSYRNEIDNGRFRTIPDCNRSHKIRTMWCAFAVGCLLVRTWPDVVISTGAAPGYFAICFGRWLGMKTIWVDSIANAEELSMSGQMAGRHAGLWLTQWRHLAREKGPAFHGGVL